MSNSEHDINLCTFKWIHTNKYKVDNQLKCDGYWNVNYLIEASKIHL